MRNNDWYMRDDEDDFGGALYRRTEELYSIPDSVPNQDGLIECPVLPLRDLVVFPRMVSPIFIGREASLLAIEESQVKDYTVIALTQRDPDEENPGPHDFMPVGVEMAVGRLLNMPDGSNSALVQGRRRVEIVEFTQLEP
ncbi:MAG: LON peptidase substrate-binding domain-containing protein, partial [Anaerolineales bacterium]|nr:LON peptidase substrate-binding domain-containing protein [Anaerolineales bacterium]